MPGMSPEPERTPDGRHIVVDGRRWRATDPAIPEDRRVELTRVLMAWRREVRRTRGTDDEKAARAGVHAAKVALGERGTPWWEQTDDERRARWEAQVLTPPQTSGDKTGAAVPLLSAPGGGARPETGRAGATDHDGGEHMSEQDEERGGRLSDEEMAQEPSDTTEGAAARGEEDPSEGSPGPAHPVGQDFPNEAVRYDETERPRSATQDD